MLVSVSQNKIDISRQDDAVVRVSWQLVDGAAVYRVYASVDKTLANGRLYAMVDSEDIELIPKQAMFGGIGWKSFHRLVSGDIAYIGVEPMDAGNASLGQITWVAITYTEIKSTLPINVYIVGGNGERNSVKAKGESVTVYYRGEVNGSYGISRYQLKRSDGVGFSWDSSSVSDNGIKSVEIKDPGIRENEGVSLTYTLTALDEVGNDVPGSVEFSVYYYGGIVGVYGKKEYYGDVSRYKALNVGERWQEGLCWVYDGEAWVKSSLVYAYTNFGWKRM